MADTGAVKTHMIIAIVVVVMGAAYLVFLAATWKQLQDDRRASFSKVDAILDRIQKSEVTPDAAGGTASAE